MIYVIFFIFSAYVFCNDEKIEFESANPFSFEDISLYPECPAAGANPVNIKCQITCIRSDGIKR